jgi:hypothetical protein
MFDCPRCGAKDIGERFYGPCQACRDHLNETLYKAPTEMAAAEAYVPKMNVTPNAVALKADD